MAHGNNDMFHWADYLLFAISLAVGIVIGIALAIKDKWLSQSSESYLMGDRKMNWFLVAMSFLASIMSARLFVAFTAEFYYSGFIIIWLLGSHIIAVAVIVIFIIPKIFRVGFSMTSAYEYFQHRFNLAVRIVVSFFYFCLTLFYMSFVLIFPSIVLSQVSVLNIYWSIFLGAIVCLFYTGFGGMKAVIWVDSIQIMIIALGILTLTIKGSIDAGGLTAVWEKYSGIGERNNWNDIDPVPWNWYNVWNVLFLWAILLVGAMGADQMVLQRYLTVPTMRRAQLSAIVGVIVGILFIVLVGILGMVIFATLGGNEPLLTKQIKTGDQIMPFFLMYSLGAYHGIPGLVIAALYAATLSTLSSGQNALAAVLLEDFIKPLHKIRTKKDLSNGAASKISRALGLVIGIAVLGISMAVPLFDGTLLSLSLSIQSFILGPILGLLAMAFFMPWVESWGALVGTVGSVAWAAMMYGGAQVHGNKLRRDYPPLFARNFTVAIRLPEPTVEPELWDVSYTWYTLLNILVTIILANIVSLIVHAIRKATHKGYTIKSSYVEDRLLYTRQDFLVAVGCRKNEMDYNKESEAEEIRDADVKSIEDIKSHENGLDNVACHTFDENPSEKIKSQQNGDVNEAYEVCRL